MSDKTFTDITDEVDALLADPAIAEKLPGFRAARDEADRAHAMGLAAVRRAFALTQTELAERLGVSQASVAQTEKRPDLLVSTLRSYLGAIGGELKLVVSFPGGAHEVEVDLDELADTADVIPAP